MPIETRTIVFNENELIKAAHVYCDRRGMAPADAKLVTVRANPVEQESVNLGYAAGDGEAVELTLSYVEMAAGLIMHCAAVGIPLPRNGRKRIAPAGDGIALIIKLPEYVGEATVAATVAGARAASA